VADVKFNRAPRSLIRPDTPDLLAGYDFRDNDLAVFGYHPNKAAAGGAAYDLNTLIGLPLVGYSGGMMVTDAAAGRRCAAATPIPVTAGTSAYAIELSGIEANPTATRYPLINGSVDGFEFRISNTGVLSCSFDRATMSSTAAGILNGKGPVRAAAVYDGASQHLMLNGVVYDSDAVVPDAPDGYFAVGEHGTMDKAEVYRARRTVAQERADYVRDFAKRIVWQWQPRDVGEGPAGGILTGSHSGVGGWTCPLGAATMGFVWRPDLSIPNGGRLCLTDSGALAMNRIDLEYGSRPFFGSVLIEYETRNPVWGGDSLIVGFTPRRGVDCTAAGSNSYWLNMYNNGGGWFRSSLYLANGAQIDGADILATTVTANMRMKCLLTRAVNGDFQVYTYCPATGWGWTAAVGNDVTVLSEGCVSIAARGPHVERITMLQGELTPHELEAVLP
jgi:hypothetical protein